ncbi:MAG: tetratricopeptide repeat protein [Spirochaetota bacterium]
MWWFFKKKKKPDVDEIVFEKWETNFSRPKQNRFVEEDKEVYSAAIVKNGLELRLKRKNLFAWTNDELYRYRDFCLEADICLADTNGYAAGGVLLRYINDENYYYFLVSSKGYYRYDLVFNGNPISLINWTEIPFPIAHSFSLRIIAHGDFFLFFVDDEWVGEIENEGIDAGGVAFAGQNYDEQDQVVIRLERFSIESRPLEVEIHYSRWNSYIPINPAYRIHFARYLYKQGQFSAAVVQLKKAARGKKLTADEYLLLGECFINLGLNQEALSSMDKALEINTESRDAVIGKGNLLYGLNRFMDLRNFLKENIERNADSSVLWNLFGNAEYMLGNWSEAAESYRKAVEIEGEMPIFSLNAAKALEKAKRYGEALDFYLKAARLLFQQEAYDDIAAIEERIWALDPDNLDIWAIKGKILFHEGNLKAAKSAFSRVLSAGYKDSSVSFLMGLIFAKEWDRREAERFFLDAVTLEPDFPLYWYRLAENRFLLGEAPGDALEKSLSLAPEDPWVLNLAGQYYLSVKNLEKAEDYLTRAVQHAPDELVIALNLSEVRFQRGDLPGAFQVFKNREENPRIYNQKGNCLARIGKFQEAAAEYEKALKMEPDNPDFLENCAAVCIQTDMINRGEELLVRLLNLHPSASAYNLIGNIARLKGEYRRAETAYIEGMKLDPENVEICLNLGDLYVESLQYEKARGIIMHTVNDDSSPRREKLLMRIRNATEIKITCDGCGREWWVSRNIEPQPSMRLHGEPPGESPAGKCPACGRVYCIQCASEYMEENRFICPECDAFLKLSDDYLRYLVSSYTK